MLSPKKFHKRRDSMGKKRVLVSIALSSVLAAYDFDPDKFQTTAWSEFEQQTTNTPFYVWENQNTANPPGVGVGFRFSGNNIYFFKDNTHINTNNINDIWIIGASGSRYILLDFTDNTLPYDKIGLHFRGGSTTTGDNHYVLLNTRYTGENGNIMRGINFDPRTAYGKMLLSIIGYDTNTQGPCNANTSGGCAPISARSLFVFRGTDVNDNIMQRYYSHDFVFGTPMAGEDFGVAVGSAQFKGDKIDFSGGFWDSNGENAANGTTQANPYTQSLVFNGADSITQDSIEFLIGSGKTTLGLYNLGTKSFNFSNLSTSSKLHLDSVGSSIAGNLLYGADSSLNLIFASSAQSLNVAREDGTTQALSSLIGTSSYLGGVPNSGQGGGANGIIGIDDSAQVSFIGANSHRFGYSTTPPSDSFQFIGSADSATPTTNRVLFLNAGNLNGAIFSTAASSAANPAPNPLYSKINFTLFGTSVTNLNLSDYPASQPSPTTANHNTLSAVFSSTPTRWSSTDTNLAPHFASMTMRTSRLSGSVSLSDTAKVNLVFDGAGTHDFGAGTGGARITGGSADSQIIFNNANGNAAGNLNYESISGFKGKILVLNSSLTSSSPSLLRSTLRAASPIATPTTRAGLASGSFSSYTHIFNGYGASVATSASAQGQSAINQVLGGFNNASGGLANYSVSDLRASTSLGVSVSSSAQNTNFVFVGTSALGSGVDLSQAAFNNVQYTFIDFGEFDLENTSKYGSATISLAGNSWARNNINVAYTGTLDVSSRNQNTPQSFYGNHLYGNTKKDVVLDFGGDLAGRSSGSSSIHKGYITGGTSDSTYIFSNIGGTLELNKTGTPAYTTNITDLNNLATNVNSSNASNLQNQLILNGINFYVSTNGGTNGGAGCTNGTGGTNSTCATIGFRDTNIKGELKDDKFGIDAVFNTSGNMVENTYTDASGNKMHIIESGSARSSTFEGSISGASKKRITFIGVDSFVRDYANSTKQGLTISGGTIDSQYNFYSVGEFTQDMVDKIINGGSGTGGSTGAQNSVARGSFSFDGSTTIFANIIKDASTSGTGNNGAKDTESINIGVNTAASTLSSFTQGVLMRGTLGGTITKNAAFASGSSVIINGGNSSSVYDFSLSGANGGALVVVKLDFKDSKRVTDGTIATGTNGNGTLHGTIKGLDGLTSIAGTLSNTIIGADSANAATANQVRFSGSLTGVGGHWFVTESSTIDSLIIENDSTLLNSANIRAGTHNNALAIVDLSTYDWVGRCHDGTSTCNATQSGQNGQQNGEYDYYELVSRDLGAGFSKKTLTIGTTTGTTSNAGTNNPPTHFSSNNGVFKLGLNLAATGDKADEVIINLTQNQNTQGVGSSRIQLIQSASTAQSYQYTSGDKIYVASLTLPNGSGFDTNTFLAEDQYLGLGIFRTELRADRENNSNTMKWYLDSIQVIDIDSATLQNEVINPLEGALLTPYLNLYTETNNMAKRMGELRGANDASGAWVKIIKGALSGTNGYYAHNMGVQGGFDKRTDLGGARVYWGVVGSFMNAWGNNYGLNLQSSSFSLGFYRSALFANSSYLDIVGKYIYSQNTYATSTASFGGRDTSGVSSAYVSAEYGMRFGIKSARGLYLQPQAEIIAGTIGGQNLRFENSLVALSVDSKASFAFIGRVGADMLSNFRFGNSGGFWRVGASLVQDFTNRGVMDIDDNVQTTSARSHTIKGDFRVLLSAGLDMRISSNSRVYFEVDRSFFGNYNLAYTISAGLRYNFGVSAPRQAPQSYPNFYEKQYLDSYSTRY